MVVFSEEGKPCGLPQLETYARMCRAAKYGNISAQQHLNVLKGPNNVAVKCMVSGRVWNLFL